MGKEEVDLIVPVKSEKKQSLLQKYDIPVEHLSYEYIGEANNAKEVERIVRILRSGEEGAYPHLLNFAEERLAVLKPNSPLLRVVVPVLDRACLDSSQRNELDSEICNWTSEMKMRERDLEDERLTPEAKVSLPLPAVRETGTFKKIESEKPKSINQEKRLTSCDYAGWDKYDADTELNRIELEEECKKAQTKRFQERQKADNLKAHKETIIQKSLLSITEINVMTVREREKGNEAFRAGEYEDALQHYNTSISIDEDLNSYNNRAMTHIKLKNYEMAIQDCNIVLKADCMNLKALLRRAMAYHHIGKDLKSLGDYESILKIDPENKTAISFVNEFRVEDNSKPVRLTIEEIYDNE